MIAKIDIAKDEKYNIFQKFHILTKGRRSISNIVETCCIQSVFFKQKYLKTTS